MKIEVCNANEKEKVYSITDSSDLNLPYVDSRLLSCVRPQLG